MYVVYTLKNMKKAVKQAVKKGEKLCLRNQWSKIANPFLTSKKLNKWKVSWKYQWNRENEKYKILAIGKFCIKYSICFAIIFNPTIL